MKSRLMNSLTGLRTGRKVCCDKGSLWVYDAFGDDIGRDELWPSQYNIFGFTYTADSAKLPSSAKFVSLRLSLQ